MTTTSDSDIKCEMRKNFKSHWIFKNVYHEFIVENKNEWVPHTVSIANLETVLKNYTILADGPKGPQITEHNNTICTQFPILKKHKETVNIL